MRKDPPLLKETKQLCELYHIRPNQKLGQNFLIDELAYEKVIVAADLKKTDRVLEVGPGLGFLTMLLSENVSQVMAVELDRRLAQTLKLRLETWEHKNATVCHGNIMDFPDSKELKDFAGKKFKIVANLPYNITSKFLQKFLLHSPKPSSMTLLLQKEVAERLAARPGDLSRLGLLAQYYADVSYVDKVGRESFYPAPEVESAVVNLKLKPTKDLPLKPAEAEKFFRLIAIGFAAKRKMLKKNLSAALDLDTNDFGRVLKLAGIGEQARAQELSMENWLKLFALIKRDVL